MTYAIVYMLIFFFAFGTMGNFGILARQRSQVMPFVFVLLASLPGDPQDRSADRPKRLGLFPKR